MPLWTDIDTSLIEVKSAGNTRTKAVYSSGPLRFQIPRGYLKYGMSQYKTISISNLDPKFSEWFDKIEKTVSQNAEPFKSALSEYGLRVKVDDSTLIFNQEGVYVPDEHVEGYLRDLDVSCIVDVEGAYLWKGIWAVSCRVHQLKFYAPVAKIPQFEMEGEAPAPAPLLKGCAFID